MSGLLRRQSGLLRYLEYRRFRASSTAKCTNTAKLTETDLNKFQKDEVVQGFVVNEVAKIHDMYLTAVRLTHLTTGAQYLHLARDDSNNVFSIAFRTTPMDSTGLPHILEHTTLCGSERYPCRDPFFKMLRRSLATFMNAMTGPDYTMYPFSTQNLKDYQNLQSVYLDSVFKPSLRELDFRQEGWRLEHTDVNDKSSPIVFKGVVFNEMKGIFNENQFILYTKFLNSILPSHTYSYISGGDPLQIPNLKHIDLVNFHANYYHPSNSRFYSYGNFPLEDHLKYVNDRYLFSSDRMDTSISVVPPEKRWMEPKKIHVNCKPDPMIADPNRQGTIAIGYLCNDITDVQTTFELDVVAQLLLDGPNSAFYKSLVEPNIGTGLGPIATYDSHCKDTLFILSLQGVKGEDFEKVESVFNETVESVVEKGFEKDHVEGVLHNIELQVKHQSANFGLNLLFKLTPLWNHDGDLVQAMKINKAVGNLREKMAQDSRYLQKIVEKYLLNNTHKLTVTMLPHAQYEQENALAEKRLLQSKLDELSEGEIQNIYEEGKILRADQEKEEDVGVLPTLKIEDLKKDVDRYSVTDLNLANVPLQLSVQPTNGVCYYRAILNTQELSDDLKDLLPLFNYVVTKIGTENYDYRTFDQMMQLTTGGLSFANHVADHKSNMDQYEEGVLIDSYCLDRNANKMWTLWTELFNNVKLDNLERFETLVKTNAADLVNGIAFMGHSYAISSATSLISSSAKLKESLSGLEYVGRMKKIAQMKDLAPILSQMKEISRHILNKTHLRSVINMSHENKDDILKGIAAFYEALQGTPTQSYLLSTAKEMNVQENGIHHVFPYTVNFTSKAILTVPYTHPEHAALEILSKLLTSIYLLPEVREKGNAYGAGAKLLSGGLFCFYSGRDPNSMRTFDLFDKAYDFIIKHPLRQSDIDEAKLGVFQQIDGPIPPHDRGVTKFLRDISDDDVQMQRERLKAVSKEQLIHVAEKYLQPGAAGTKIGRSLIGPSNPDLLKRSAENWIVLDQEEESRAQAAK